MTDRTQYEEIIETLTWEDICTCLDIDGDAYSSDQRIAAVYFAAKQYRQAIDEILADTRYDIFRSALAEAVSRN